MFRFTIRELVLLTLVVAMSVGWWLDHRHLADLQRMQHEALAESELRIKNLEGPKQSVTEDQLADAPLTLAVSTVGMFSKGRSWHLGVNPAGQAELTIETTPERTRRRFELTPQQMATLRKLIVEEQFFALAGSYGEEVPDSSERSVTVCAGTFHNTVRIHYLRNTDKATLHESSRALRLLVLVQGWIDESEAADLRKYDQLILDGVK